MMNALWYDWLLLAGLMLVSTGTGLLLLGLLTRYYRAALVGTGLLAVALLMLLNHPALPF